MTILDWRKSNSVTQTKLAILVGVGTPHISRIERGEMKPSIEIAKRIEAATNGEVTAAELLGLDAPPVRGVSETTTSYLTNAVSVMIPQDLFESATAYGLDIAALLAEGGVPHLRAAFKEEYIRRNQKGIERTRQYVEEHGAPGDQAWRQQFATPED